MLLLGLWDENFSIPQLASGDPYRFFPLFKILVVCAPASQPELSVVYYVLYIWRPSLGNPSDDSLTVSK